ncbi:hypothetical protein COT42_08165 [Candidatus Saganbacteria bacterium CG08_land_8_20_14_0_20_45_16]|uniref:Uncharacterized protein n=1 Tax=Candidatus Saganbacteria bacterium CG08_land_8_20_14_0_20_45_16 TaxID=2014293 RepID=A0A2H0XTY3_UNCSA|nr:MAG: hypothetical protein COT42_08165 [Candidatus Saganbacteria bacterium CG08_land_8_20_14_0_20_45_16]
MLPEFNEPERETELAEASVVVVTEEREVVVAESVLVDEPQPTASAIMTNEQITQAKYSNALGP